MIRKAIFAVATVAGPSALPAYLSSAPHLTGFRRRRGQGCGHHA